MSCFRLLITIEQMNQELQARLRRLGVVKGARNLKSRREGERSPAPGRRPLPQSRPGPRDDEPQSLETLLPGLRLAETADGACYTLDKVYPLTHRHGAGELADLLAADTSVAALFLADERLAGLNFRDFLFLDTETTGLGGAGTIAFMVGVAYYEADAFVVRQYFLRDHGDEPAMLLLLDELMGDRPGLITFNGRSFDLPLLDGRFLMNRLPSDVQERPHIDLLPPARRLWRLRFQSCALSSLEEAVLDLARTHEDVPGWMIPALYNNYLRTGDGRELSRVFYHNRIDLLSMVTLAARVLRHCGQPDPGDHPLELLGLGRWQADLGLVAEAEKSLRLAADPELPTPLYRQALTHLAYLLKRDERREEALPVWQQLACTSFEDVTAHVELAKHFEWHEPDLAEASRWTEEALALVRRNGDDTVLGELEHRLARLQRKRQRDREP